MLFLLAMEFPRQSILDRVWKAPDILKFLLKCAVLPEQGETGEGSGREWHSSSDRLEETKTRFSRGPHANLKMLLMKGRNCFFEWAQPIIWQCLEQWFFIWSGFKIRVGGNSFLSFLTGRRFSSNVILRIPPSVSIHFNFQSHSSSTEREEVLGHLQTTG